MQKSKWGDILEIIFYVYVSTNCMWSRTYAFTLLAIADITCLKYKFSLYLFISIVLSELTGWKYSSLVHMIKNTTGFLDQGFSIIFSLGHRRPKTIQK